MNVLLVREGSKYSWQYVVALQKQIRLHNEDVKVTTLTNRDDNPGVSKQLKTSFPGWWAKFELFAPWNRSLRPALYIDLDSFVLGDITGYDMGDTFTMVEDFNGWCRGNSSVMWLPKDTKDIWQPIEDGFERIKDDCGGRGDQHYLAQKCRNFWSTPDHGIVSYKVHGQDGPVGNIMQFHGNPKPLEAGGWAQKHWEDCFAKRGPQITSATGFKERTDR